MTLFLITCVYSIGYNEYFSFQMDIIIKEGSHSTRDESEL